MNLRSESIRSLYALNLLEGEGLGTSYEYYVKFRKLEKFVRTVRPLNKILIAGLPEKYGLSLDFFLLGRILSADIMVIDERADKIEEVQRVLEVLKHSKNWRDCNVTFLQVEDLSDALRSDLLDNHHDLALSCEVLQRLGESRSEYVSGLKKVSSNFSLFVPNQTNQAHTQISGLKGIRLKELIDLLQREQGIQISDHGYIDMPPFPPGISRSKEERDRASKSLTGKILMKGLEIYSRMEKMFPRRFKEKKAHIVFVSARVL
jgi:hypothetical protein